MAELLGKPEVSLAISKITRVDETTFKVERTFGGKLFLKDSPMTIEKTKLTLDNKPESVYRIKIDYKKFGINQGCLPDFYIYNNRVIYFDKTTNNWSYGATK